MCKPFNGVPNETICEKCQIHPVNLTVLGPFKNAFKLLQGITRFKELCFSYSLVLLIIEEWLTWLDPYNING